MHIDSHRICVAAVRPGKFEERVRDGSKAGACRAQGDGRKTVLGWTCFHQRQVPRPSLHTALRINGIQVTNEIIPWTEFLKTQPGARIEKIETPQSADTPAAEPTPAAEEPEAEESYDSSDDIDDLFDDDPKPKKKAAKPAVAKRPAKAAPPPPATTIVFDGEFKPNDKTRQMVARINKARTRVETTLRNGGCYFFGARYMPFSVDRLPTEMLLSSLPDVMKSNTVFEQFSSAARAKGLTFISENVMRELFRNRLDYIRLQARAKAVKEGGKWGTTL